jgi:hypothetical protein
MNRSGNSPGALEDLHAAYRKHLYLPDPGVVDFAMAHYVAAKLRLDPLWGLIVAPPSSGKTETLMSLKGCPGVHAMSSLTPKTFLSGAKDKPEQPSNSLLLRLDRIGQLLILKDFGTIMSMNGRDQAEILSQLREIYDGEYEKDYGNGQRVVWEGSLGFIAGVTPSIDAHHEVIATLGERFLYFRIAEADRAKVAQTAMRRTRESNMREELKDSATSFINSRIGGGVMVPDLGEE